MSWEWHVSSQTLCDKLLILLSGHRRCSACGLVDCRTRDQSVFRSTDQWSSLIDSIVFFQSQSICLKLEVSFLKQRKFVVNSLLVSDMLFLWPCPVWSKLMFCWCSVVTADNSMVALFLSAMLHYRTSSAELYLTCSLLLMCLQNIVPYRFSVLD